MQLAGVLLRAAPCALCACAAAATPVTPRHHPALPQREALGAESDPCPSSEQQPLSAAETELQRKLFRCTVVTQGSGLRTATTCMNEGAVTRELDAVIAECADPNEPRLLLAVELDGLEGKRRATAYGSSSEVACCGATKAAAIAVPPFRGRYQLRRRSWELRAEARHGETSRELAAPSECVWARPVDPPNEAKPSPRAQLDPEFPEVGLRGAVRHYCGPTARLGADVSFAHDGDPQHASVTRLDGNACCAIRALDAVSLRSSRIRDVHLDVEPERQR